jgi:glycosyltransferase involved in cell wall biosynthesis
MKITSFVHVGGTLLPGSGVTRHINGVLRSLHAEAGIDLRLLLSRKWLDRHGRLPANNGIPGIPFDTFPWPELPAERLWKFMNWPRLDSYIPKDTDWAYSPKETRLPIRKCPVAMTVHDVKMYETDIPLANSPENLRIRKRWDLWIHKALRECRVVFTVSEFSKRRMVELLGADPGKIAISGNGFEERCLELRHRPRTGIPKLLVIGGLRILKGAKAVLAAARFLKERVPEARIVVAGPNDPDSQAEGEALGNFEFLGWVSDERLFELLGEARILLFLSEYEGFGIPALEAMAAGIPPVVSNKASLPEIVGDCGFVVDSARPEAVADLLAELVRNPRTYDADRGEAHARRSTWEHVAKRVVETLRSI